MSTLELAILPSKRMNNKDNGNIVRLNRFLREKTSAGNLNDKKISLEVDSSDSIEENTSAVIKPVLQEDLEDLRKLPIFHRIKDNFAFVSEKLYAILSGDQNLDGEEVPMITIGSDPEFVVSNRSDDVCQYAQQVIPDNNKKKRFGSDGPCAELRPKHALTAREAVLNIKAALDMGMKSPAKDSKWIGGCIATSDYNNGRIFQIGGHIHVGEPSIPGVTTSTLKDMRVSMVRLLDEKVAIPLARIEGKDGYQRRKLNDANNTTYGEWGDFREKTNRFEWRSPSGIWVISPVLTNAVISVVKGISEGIYRELKEGMEEKNMKDDGYNSSMAVKDNIKRNLLKLDLPNLEACKALLRDIGGNFKKVEEEYNKVVSSLKDLATEYPEIDKEQLGIFIEIAEKAGKLKLNKYLKEMWVEDKKDDITESGYLTELDKEQQAKNKSNKNRVKLIRVNLN